MGLPTCMSAAATRTVVLYFDVVLGLLEGQTHFLPSEHISVEILAENLRSFIIDLILRIDHDAILSPRFVEYFPDNLRVAGVDEDQFGHRFLLVFQNLAYLLGRYGAQLSDCILGVVLELELPLLGAVADDVEDFGFLVGDKMFEVLLGCDLAVEGDFGFVGVLGRGVGTLRADSRRCSSDLKSTGKLAYLCFF